MISIVDYNAGNLTSVKRALDNLGLPCRITADAREIEDAERIIFPGVGHAASAMKVIRERGIDKALATAYAKGTPILGICLGTQIILSYSEESDTPCLGLINGTVRKFSLHDPLLKIPHMGWNSINIIKPHPILKNTPVNAEFYFVHSYYPQPADNATVFATCDYETVFAAAIGKNNLFATQFHLEKSGRIGLSLLTNFSTWDGKSC